MIKNKELYLQEVSKIQKLKLAIVGQDPYPSGSNGIAFCKNTFEEFFHPSCCGKEVLYSLGFDRTFIQSHFNNPIDLFFYLLEEGICFLNISSVLLKDNTEQSLNEDKNYNEQFLSKSKKIVILGLGQATKLFNENYNGYHCVDYLIHPSGLAKKKYNKKWEEVWTKQYLKITYLTIFNSKNKDMQLEDYFDLTVKNEDLFSAGEVEKGKHGVEIIDGDYYASLYHIQNGISKGKLKEFLEQFKGSKMLTELGNSISKEYPFRTVKVKYINQSFEIKKFPYTAILGYFEKLNSQNSNSHTEIIDMPSGFEQYNGRKPIRLGKAAGEFSMGISTLVKFLNSKGIEVDDNPNYKLSAKEYRILKLEFSTTLKNTIQLVSEELKVGMTPLVELLVENGFGISKLYHPNDPLTDDEYYFLVEKLSKTESKISLDEWLEELGELTTNGIGVGFKNFRRFESFPMIELGDITFLVGKNNSGKSTLVKALLLFLNSLQQPKGNRFTFAGNVLNDANIVTFDRAIYRNNTNGQIDINLKLGNVIYSVNISGKEDSTDAVINVLKFYEQANQLYFEIDFNTNEIFFLRKALNTDAYVSGDPEEVQWYMDQIDNLKKELSSLPNKLTREGLTLVDQINKLQSQLENLKFLIPETNKKKEDITYFASTREPLSEKYSLRDAITDFYQVLDIEDQGLFTSSSDNMKKLSELELENSQLQKQKVKALKNDIIINDIFKHVLMTIENEQFFYLGANPSKQSALFLIRDKGNVLAQAIHEYKQANIPDGSLVHSFVIKWMKEFEIGTSFSIEIYAGEAYEFYVTDDKGSHHLSDKGMGSIQSMMLILRIASLIHNKKSEEQRYTVMVEEPELNLHPRLQSKLTELFHEVNKQFGFRFIIETHSEYMIRSSQEIGLRLENEYFIKSEMNLNPFKVFYFDKELPYEMEYTEEGRFNRNFGEGFYNEAGRLNLLTLKAIKK